MRFERIVLGLAAMSLSVVVPPIVRAQCPPTPPLTSGVSASVSVDPAFFSFTPSVARWSAVAVRSGDAQTWNLDGLDITTFPPGCFHGGLGSTNGTGVNFLVTDWRFRALDTDYVRAKTGLSIGVAARVEFEQTVNQASANRAYEQALIDPTDVITVNEVQLDAGIPNFFEFWTAPAQSGLHVYLFAPITSGTGYATKADAVFDLALVLGGNGFTYTPSVSGMYAIVITNEDATSGLLKYVVKHCPYFTQTLFDNQPYFSAMLEDYPGFTPAMHGWNFVAVRGEPFFQYQVNIAPGPRYQSWFNWECTDSVLGSQYSGLGVKVVAEDFRRSPLRPYQTRMALQGQPNPGAGEAYLEWEDGADVIAVNDPPHFVAPPAHNIVDGWNIQLVKDGTYTFTLDPEDGATANYVLVLFKNDVPWPSRNEAVFDGTAPIVYTPTSTDLYGLAVLNENGGTGGYAIQVTSDLVGVGPGAGAVPGASRIRSVSPNPTFAGTRVDYELARASEVSLRVTDVAGREIARVSGARHEAGLGSLAWDGRVASGARPPAGVYFVTFVVDGVGVDRAKAIVLR